MQIRSTTEADLDTFLSTLCDAFGSVWQSPGESPWWAAYEMDRHLLAEDAAGRPIGTAGAYSFELTLPGGATAPAAGITGVGVLPSHRRQGVLSALMRHQLEQLRGAGEFLAVLLATEAVIYRRFGYGPASYRQRVAVDLGRGAFAVPVEAGGSIELRHRADCEEELAEVYDRVRLVQPGALSRPAHWWAKGAGRPPVSRAPRHIAFHRDAAGRLQGYACYTIAVTDQQRSLRTLTVEELVAATDEAQAALARYCLDHDLVSTVVFADLPPRSPLRWRLADYRAARTEAEQDYLWVRLLDVPRALAARGYPADGRLVVEVDDPFLGERGRYLLVVADGVGVCEPTGEPTELALDVADLGSLYLGGTRASDLVRAGRIRELVPGAALRADALLGAEREPHCVHFF
ncbi:GNAT family N-acetyltransferase [Kitasatospora viridis]|uniref:Putative acetyltransferase n=1 Tax=Kitasatospora viridis TaxID=281105 RepID=A0A561UIC3_9ACTN|nr:GNAT family N-acetyltransferase [Kitasatospora viridis]TWF99118.1 putative acetyltransferase [Kitasatospora viridis]